MHLRNKRVKQKSGDQFKRKNKGGSVWCKGMNNKKVYTNLFILIIIVIFSSISYTSSEAQRTNQNINNSTPAIYVLGDSLVDVGNNNYLHLSLDKADFPHNGIDFPTGSTGRFSNGKNTADFIGN